MLSLIGAIFLTYFGLELVARETTREIVMGLSCLVFALVGVLDALGFPRNQNFRVKRIVQGMVVIALALGGVGAYLI